MELKSIAREIFASSLTAIDIPATLRRKLSRHGTTIHCGDSTIDLAAFRAIRVAAFGKAAGAMVEGLCQVLSPEFACEGVLSVPVPPVSPPPGFRTFVAGHPVPTSESLAAGRAILELLAGCNEHTLVFFLLSGGGSSLVEAPLDARVTLADVQALHRLLVTCGAPIDAINAVRKHLSAVKGGRLAAAAPRAMKITLGVSDVPEGRESALASGPAQPDPTTVADARAVLEEYGLGPQLPPVLRESFERAVVPETPKPGNPAFSRAHFSVLLGMHDLFHSAHRAAEERGFRTICDNSTDDWPLSSAADHLLAQLDLLSRQHPDKPVAVIADGEVSSPVTGQGTGGRNSSFVLDCVEKIAGRPLAVLSAGTDGVDGNSPAAGAVADGQSSARARAAGLEPADFFRRSDAYSFFRVLGDAVETGPTGNNLRDLRILLAAPAGK